MAMPESGRRARRSLMEALREYIEDLRRTAMELMETLMGPEGPCWDPRASSIKPLTHISVSPDEVVITMDLPLVRPETIRVKPVEEDVIEVIAEMKRTLRPQELGMVHVEGEIRQLRCKTRVPVPVETKAMRFVFRKGILEVRLPRKRRISIG